MKFFFISLILVLPCQAVDVTLRNRSPYFVYIDNTLVNPYSTIIYNAPSTIVAVERMSAPPTSIEVYEVIDGSLISVSERIVQAIIPLSSYLEIFLKGFFFMMAFELFGLMLGRVRQMRISTGMEG